MTAKLLKTQRQFEKDLRRARKRGLNLTRLDAVVQMLARGEPLAARLRAHKLSDAWGGAWECHVAPDWLLIWIEDEAAVTL